MIMTVLGQIFRWALLELPARNKETADFVAELETTGNDIHTTIANAVDTENHHRVVTHIIGIERWAQERLKALLDSQVEPPTDEYDAYRPARETAWDDLPQVFHDTRQQTIALAQQFDPSTLADTVPHNQFGDVSGRGWLQYITSHATREITRLS